jgi:L-asparagine oxygenase
LPKQIIESLHQFKQGLTPTGAILITNLPLDPNIPPTPTNGRMVKQKSNFVSEAILLGIGRFMGYFFGYNNHHGGEFIHCVAPKLGSEQSISAFGSGCLFDFHVEATYCTPNPDFLGLLCLRESSGQKVITTISDNQNAIDKLPDNFVKILGEENYELQQSEIYTDHQQAKRKKISIIKDDNKKKFCFNFNTIRALNNSAAEALANFKQQLIADRIEIILEKGDLLLIDNNRCCHSRTEFKAFYDGNDRWIMRGYISSNLEKSVILDHNYDDT